MDQETARRMSELTTEFYARTSASFSATRQAPWPGWARVLEACGVGRDSTLSLLDLACGNLRFGRYVAERVRDVRIWAVDNCDELVGTPVGLKVHYQHLDVVEDPDGIDAPACDLAVSFGFFHHVPLTAQRRAVMRALARHVAPGGHLAASFWQLERSPRLRAKARPVRGGEAGDYLLGWQDRTDVARFCHSFSEDEIDALVASLGLGVSEVARFSADGKSGDLNRYVVMRVDSLGWG